MSRLGEQGASIFDCATCRQANNNNFNDQDLQQAQKTDLQNYADKLKKGKVTYSDYAPISLEEQQKAIAEENNLNNDETATPANAAKAWAGFIYYYHPDHLGTSTALTDFNGQPNQFFLNLPFGEMKFIEFR